MRLTRFTSRHLNDDETGSRIQACKVDPENRSELVGPLRDNLDNVATGCMFSSTVLDGG